MKILQDLHIHSHHSFDSACATLSNIRLDHEDMGIRHYAVTDHLNTRYSISDIESCRHDFLRGNFPPNFHFGVEAAITAAWESERIAAGDYVAAGDIPITGFRMDERPFDGRMCIALEEEDIRKYGIELVVAGVHWPLGFPETHAGVLDNYFQQQMFLANHPLVHVIAHPWESLGHAAGDWFHHRDKQHIDWSVFRDIPQEMDDLLCEAMLKNGKFAEINIGFMTGIPEEVMRLRMERSRRWRDAGLKFTCGSDQHSEHPNPERFSQMERILDEYGFTEEDFALPPSLNATAG